MSQQKESLKQVIIETAASHGIEFLEDLIEKLIGKKDEVTANATSGSGDPLPRDPTHPKP